MAGLAEWSQIVPPESDAPAEVQQAHAQVAALRAKLPAQRQALSDAQAATTTAEADDRRRMAEELRAGRSAKADARAVDKAQQRVAAVRREGEALALAIQGAEDQLGEAARTHAPEWLATASSREQVARARARELVGELRGTLEELSQARSTGWWIENDLPNERRYRTGGLGHLAGSARVTANADPVSMIQALGWLEETLTEPEPPQPAPEVRPLQPIPAFGAYPGPR